MKEKFLNFCEKHLTGGYSVKVKKELYVNFPKLAPIFTLGFLLSAIGETKDVNPMTYTGYALVLVGIFGFFFHNIFPKRK